MLISEVAEKVGLHPETIRRLERRGAIAPAARDVNGWRRYSSAVVDQIKILYAAEVDRPSRGSALEIEPEDVAAK